MRRNKKRLILNEIRKNLNEIADLLKENDGKCTAGSHGDENKKVSADGEINNESKRFIRSILQRKGLTMGEGSNANQLLLGIDLGTSRTAVMSNRGAKTMVSSVVGYPKDIIAIKLLGESHIIGGEAVEKRSYLDLYYPLQDGVLKEASERDLEAARLLIKHAVDLAEPRQRDEVCGIIGVPARASIANKGHLLEIAKEYMELAMVVSEPFMVAYNMNKLKNSIVVDIGAGTIDMCAMKGTVPTADDQVTIIKGGDYIDELLEKAIIESYPGVQMTTHLARTIKERHAFVGEPSERVFARLREEGKPKSFDLTDEVRVACETIVADIVENLETLIQRFDPEDQDEAIRNIIVAGGGSQIKGLDVLITKSLGDYGDVQVQCVDDPEYAGCAGALKLSEDLPPKYWDQIGDLAG